MDCLFLVLAVYNAEYTTILRLVFILTICFCVGQFIFEQYRVEHPPIRAAELSSADQWEASIRLSRGRSEHGTRSLLLVNSGQSRDLAAVTSHLDMGSCPTSCREHVKV